MSEVPDSLDSLGRIKQTLMEGSQATYKINKTELIWRQISLINYFQSLADQRFITAVDSLEDTLASDIDEDFKKDMDEAEKLFKTKIDGLKNTLSRNPEKLEANLDLSNWNLARIRFRALGKLIDRRGYEPPRDVVQDDEPE